MWNQKTLQQINQADDLKIAPFHPDMQTTGTPTWIWEVVVENRLFVRAYFGTNSRWYQAAITQKAGKIHAIGKVFSVAFEPIKDEILNQHIDDAYRSKYHSSQYMSHMIGTGSRAATVEILLQEV